MKHGSLFSGYLGLTMATERVFGGSLAWVSDIDAGACRILDHRAPDVPNLGDITKTDWRDVEPVDVIDGGFPCQPVSHAGKRLGDDDERWLWDEFARAIGALRPRYVVLENVRGLLSAGRGRLFGRVLADLAAERYDAQWCLLRAADVGAPHGRARVFVVATDTERVRCDGRTPEPRGRPFGGTAARGASPVAQDADRATGDQWWLTAPGQAEGGRARADTGGRGRTSAPDAGGERHGRGQDARSLGRVDGGTEGDARERQWAVAGDRGDAATADTDRAGLDGERWFEPIRRDPDGCGRADVAWGDAEHAAAADAEGARRDRCPGSDAQSYRRGERPGGADADGRVDWGQYEPAIRRWERVLGRSAPAPTQPGRTGNPQLSPRFVEWMQGIPEGWVTDVPGLTRNQQLKALGNGVCPQQAEAAERLLLAREAAA